MADTIKTDAPAAPHGAPGAQPSGAKPDANADPAGAAAAAKPEPKKEPAKAPDFEGILAAEREKHQKAHASRLEEIDRLKKSREAERRGREDAETRIARMEERFSAVESRLAERREPQRREEEPVEFDPTDPRAMEALLARAVGEKLSPLTQEIERLQKALLPIQYAQADMGIDGQLRAAKSGLDHLDDTDLGEIKELAIARLRAGDPVDLDDLRKRLVLRDRRNFERGVGFAESAKRKQREAEENIVSSQRSATEATLTKKPKTFDEFAEQLRAAKAAGMLPERPF